MARSRRVSGCRVSRMRVNMHLEVPGYSGMLPNSIRNSHGFLPGYWQDSIPFAGPDLLSTGGWFYDDSPPVQTATLLSVEGEGQ